MKSITRQTVAGITVTACIISFGIGFWIGSGSNWIYQFISSSKKESSSISLTPVDNPYEHTGIRVTFSYVPSRSELKFITFSESNTAILPH